MSMCKNDKRKRETDYLWILSIFSVQRLAAARSLLMTCSCSPSSESSPESSCHVLDEEIMSLRHHAMSPRHLNPATRSPLSLE